jgi:excisionase family DNA binding protein
MSMSVLSAELLTVEEVAARLRLSPKTVRRRIADGELPAVQLGGPGHALRIPASAFEDPAERRAPDLLPRQSRRGSTAGREGS